MDLQWLYPDKPDVIYSALVTGSIVLLTAFLTNRQSRQRQERDLLHQAEQKEKERLHNLKRDIYIPLTEAHSIAVAFLGKMPNAPADLIKAMDPLQTLGHLVAKLSLIAPPKVLEPVSLCLREIIKVATKMAAERWHIDEISGEMSVLDTGIQWHPTYQQNQSDRLQKIGDADNANAAKMESISKSGEWSYIEFNRLLSLKQALITKKAVLELALIQKLSGDLRGLGILSTNALISIRDELGLPIDSSWMLAFQAQNMDAAHSIVEDFRSAAEQRISSDNEQ